MPKPRATDLDRAGLASLIEDRQGLDHLLVKKHGNALILCSEFEGDPIKHARLLKLNQSKWALSFANHRGRWEPTPFRGTKKEMFELLATQFPWTIAPLD